MALSMIVRLVVLTVTMAVVVNSAVVRSATTATDCLSSDIHSRTTKGTIAPRDHAQVYGTNLNLSCRLDECYGHDNDAVDYPSKMGFSLWRSGLMVRNYKPGHPDLTIDDSGAIKLTIENVTEPTSYRCYVEKEAPAKATVIEKFTNESTQVTTTTVTNFSNKTIVIIDEMDVNEIGLSPDNVNLSCIMFDYTTLRCFAELENDPLVETQVFFSANEQMTTERDYYYIPMCGTYDESRNGCCFPDELHIHLNETYTVTVFVQNVFGASWAALNFSALSIVKPAQPHRVNLPEVSSDGAVTMQVTMVSADPQRLYVHYERVDGLNEDGLMAADYRDSCPWTSVCLAGEWVLEHARFIDHNFVTDDGSSKHRRIALVLRKEFSYKLRLTSIPLTHDGAETGYFSEPITMWLLSKPQKTTTTTTTRTPTTPTVNQRETKTPETNTIATPIEPTHNARDQMNEGSEELEYERVQTSVKLVNLIDMFLGRYFPIGRYFPNSGE